MTGVAYPLRFEGRGRTAESHGEAHVRDLIEQSCSRLRGSGEPARLREWTLSARLRARERRGRLHHGVSRSGALPAVAGDVIDVQMVDVEAVEGTLLVRVGYTIRRSQRAQTASSCGGSGT